MSFIHRVDMKVLNAVIVKVPVGRLPKKTIDEICTNLKENLRRIFPGEIEIMLVPAIEARDYQFIFLENYGD